MVNDVLYAIYDPVDKRVIWNARGSAYKTTKDVEKKLSKLKKEYPEKSFRVLKYRLEIV